MNALTLITDSATTLAALPVLVPVHGRGKVPTGGHVRSPRVAK